MASITSTLKTLGYSDKEARSIRNIRNRYKISLEIAIEYFNTKDKSILINNSNLCKIGIGQYLKNLGYDDKTVHNIRNIKNRYKIPLEIAVEYYETKNKQLLAKYSTLDIVEKDKLCNRINIRKTKVLCKRLGLIDNDIRKIIVYLKNGITLNSAVMYVKLKDEALLNSKITITQLYKTFNLSTSINTVRSLRNKDKFKEYSDLEVIAYYLEKERLNNGEDSLRKVCIDAEVNYSTACDVKRRNPSFNNKQIIDYVRQSEIDRQYSIIINGNRVIFKNIKQAVNELNIKYTSMMQRISSLSCTTEQAILYYRPDCYINILGELVIPK